MPESAAVAVLQQCKRAVALLCHKACAVHEQAVLHLWMKFCAQKGCSGYLYKAHAHCMGCSWMLCKEVTSVLQLCMGHHVPAESARIAHWCSWLSHCHDIRYQVWRSMVFNSKVGYFSI